MLKIKKQSTNCNTVFNVFQNSLKIASITVSLNRGGQSAYRISNIPGCFPTLEKCKEAISKKFPQ